MYIYHCKNKKYNYNSKLIKLPILPTWLTTTITAPLMKYTVTHTGSLLNSENASVHSQTTEQRKKKTGHRKNGDETTRYK